MRTFARIAAAGLLILGIFTTVAVGDAWGAGPRTRLVPTPGIAPVPGLPLVGYHYRVVPGYGFRVTGVMAGTPAAAIGLEPGDVVLSLNGYRLTQMGADVPARADAARHGGWARLRIQDVRTGRIAHRSVNLFHPHGHVGPIGPIGPIHPGPIGPIHPGPIMPGPGMGR